MLARPLQPSDQPALAELFEELSLEPYFSPHTFTVDAAQHICTTMSEYYCGLFHDDILCAYGLLRWGVFEYPSLGIAVRRTFRRLGLSKLLMQHLHGVAQERSARKIRLRVHPSNSVAIGLYKKLGYRFEGDVDRGELVGWYDLP